MSKTQQHALAKAGLAFDLGEFADDREAQRLAQDDRTPFLAFHASNSDRAMEVARAIDGVEIGQPYLCVGDQYYDAAQAKLIQLAEFRYFGTKLDPKGVPAKFHPFDSEPEDGKEFFLTLTLVVIGEQVIPTVTTYRTVKCPIARGILQAQLRARTAEWAKQSKTHGAIAGKLPPRYRVTGKIRLGRPKTSAAGFDYIPASAKTEAMDSATLEAIETWASNPDLQERFERVFRTYLERKTEVETAFSV